MNLTKREKAYDILKNYNGENEYILQLKKGLFISRKLNDLSDFQIEYVLSNKDYVQKSLNRITELCDWYAEKKKNEWNTDFLPTKVLINSIIGETKDYYHVYLQYRQSVPPTICFLSKKGVLKNFLVDDFNQLSVDFDRYDRLSMSKDPNRRLKEHQKTAIKFLLSRKKCILADEMGLGKSNSLAVASVEGNFDSILIICPASLKLNWRDELLWYVNEKDITIIDSFQNKTKPELEKFLGYKEGKSKLSRAELLEEANANGKWQYNKYVIINYDILDEFFSLKKSKDANNELLSFIKDRKSLIIIDEAHKLSNRTSDRYKIINKLIKQGNPDSLYLATGTPVTNNPQNLFCILQLVGDPLADDWDYYMRRYCDAMKIPAKGEKAKWTDIFLKKKHKGSWFDLSYDEKEDLKEFINNNAKKITITNGASNLDELEKRLSHIYLRRIKDDLNLMPEKIIHEAVYDLTPDQEIEYNNLWDEYVEQKKEDNYEGEINKDLLEGAIYRRYISNIMIPYTKRIVDYWLKKGEKVVIICCYDDELYTLYDEYKDIAVYHNGKMNAKQKDNSVKEFMNNPDVKVFIGNYISAGVGITLTSASKLVFNNMSFVPGENRQCEDRIFRIGQKKDCDIYYQYFRGTQYENIWNTVLKKETVINNIIKKEDEKQ